MKKAAIIVCCMLASILAFSASAEVIEFGNWELAYYVDEFKLPTNEAYIVNSAPIEGTFCNSAVDDAHLKVSFLLDEHDLAFVLYEYGDNKVKNSFSSDQYYDVTMLDDAREKTYMSGTMLASGGDRILFGSDEIDTILNALQTNSVLSFYIAETNNPTTNYLFTIGETAGISEAILSLEASINEVDYQAAVKLYNSGKYHEALSVFKALGSYKDSAEWQDKYQAMKYGEAEELLAAKNYIEANEAFIEAGNYNNAAQRVGEPYYVQGELLLLACDFDGALAAFEKAGSFVGAKESIYKTHYKQAEMLLEVGNYAGANEAFIAAGSYGDAQKRVGEPYYLLAEKLLAEKNYAAANDAFIAAGDYSDAKQRVGESYYVLAEELLAIEDYVGANEALIAADNYGDARSRLGEPYYILAEKLLEAGDYAASNEAFIEAGRYGKSGGRVGEPFYILAKSLEAAGDKSLAAMRYASAGAYQDAKERSKALWEEILFRETISAGHGCTVGVTDDGTVNFIGHDSSYYMKLLWDWKDVVAVSAGSRHIVGLKADGTVVAVGSNDCFFSEYQYSRSGQCDVENWTGIVAVSAGGDYTVGLKENGTVVAVGCQHAGIKETKKWRDIVAVSAGYEHVVGLKSDGTVVASGNDEELQCRISGWKDIVDISAGGHHTIGLKADGTVVVTGFDFDHVEEEWSDIVAVSAGSRHVMGLKSDGTVVAASKDGWQSGKLSEYTSDIWNDIVAISAGQYHSVGLKADGTVVALGSDKAEDGECNVSTMGIIAVDPKLKEPMLKRQYETAEKLLAMKDYTGALSAFKAMGDYSDSKQRIPQIHYSYAESLMDLGDLIASAKQFDAAGDYLDAREKSLTLWEEIYPAMEKGSKGDDVKTLQQALINQGFLSGKVDGDYGNKTVQAVKSAQKAFGMEETGIADHIFQKKLYENK